jgi:hypothetical protein
MFNWDKNVGNKQDVGCGFNFGFDQEPPLGCLKISASEDMIVVRVSRKRRYVGGVLYNMTKYDKTVVQRKNIF